MDLITTTESSISVTSTPKVEEIDIEKQYQKERGKPMPSKNHSRIQRRLTVILDKLLSEKYDIYPEFEIELLGKKSVPDISILPLEEPDWKNDTLRGKTPPLLTIEILSPKQALSSLLHKVRDVHFPAGVSSSWIVIPELKQITVMYPNDKIITFNDGNFSEDVFGLNIDLADIFK